MTVIELVEYQDVAVSLERRDVSFLRTLLAGKIRVTRPALDEGFVLNSQQFVGVVRLPSGTVLRCQSKVPIANLTRMLAEAVELPELLDESVQLERVDDLLELTARHFVSLVLRIIDSGMYRAYVEHAENLTALRGRIDFQEDVRSNYALRHRVFCRFAELTWDVPHNQVIRQVLRLLSAQPTFSKSLRNELRSAEGMMSDVSEGHFVASDLDRFTYQRLTLAYEPVHRLCRLFLEGASLSESLGTFDGRAFLVDMNALFERFVTRVLQRLCPPGLHVRAQLPLHLDEQRTVPIRPDMTIQHGRRSLAVADCKYKAAKDEFRSSDAYQVLAYCTVTGANDGVLIYPKSEISGGGGSIRVRGTSVTIRQVGIDLGVRPGAWVGELDSLARRVFPIVLESVDPRSAPSPVLSA